MISIIDENIIPLIFPFFLGTDFLNLFKLLFTIPEVPEKLSNYILKFKKLVIIKNNIILFHMYSNKIMKIILPHTPWKNCIYIIFVSFM